MTIETLQMLSVISYVLAGVLLLVGSVLFFALKIPRLIGELSGSTARKAIENIRQQNSELGDQTLERRTPNTLEKRTTEKISRSGRLSMRERNSIDGIGTQKLSASIFVPTSGETVLLRNTGSEETTLLSNLAPNKEAVPQSSGETTLLTTSNNDREFSVEMEIHFTGSSELIE